MRNKKLVERIYKLTERGLTQIEIARALHCGRSTVHCAHRLLEVSGHRPGPRTPVVSEGKILEQLRLGHSRAEVERMSGATTHMVRTVAEKHGISTRHPENALAPHERAQLIAEIRQRQDYAINLAEKFRVPYKTALRLAHRELRVPIFIGSRTTPPLSSPFPPR